MIDGSTGTNVLDQAKVFHEKFGLTGLVVTKLDGSSKGGSLVSIFRGPLLCDFGVLRSSLMRLVHPIDHRRLLLSR